RVPTVIGPRSPRLASRSRDRSRELFGIGPRAPMWVTSYGGSGWGRNGPVTQLGSGCHGLSTLQPGKWRASSRAGEAERRAPQPCRSDEKAGVRLISSELLCILLSLGRDRRSPLL